MKEYESKEQIHDLAIIGSGPAGLSAAVYAQRAMLDTVVLEKEPFSGGQIVTTERVDNYLGLYGESGYALANRFREHAEALNVPFLQDDVEAIANCGINKELRLAGGRTIAARAVILASGAAHKKLGVEGEQELSGAGVSYCATCDGAFFRNKSVAVIGGGDVALEDALYLSNLCEMVYLIHRREGFRAARVLQERIQARSNITFLPYYEVVRIAGDNAVQSLLLKQNQTGKEKEIAVSGVFIAVGMEPQSELLRGIVELDAAGYVVAAEDCCTSVDGILAAGDVRTKPLRQIVTAVADGAAAVASVEKYLMECS